MLHNPHEITRIFEEEICKYTNSPFCVCVDNQSNALYLCLVYYKKFMNEPDNTEVWIPRRTYPSVPCEIIRAGFEVGFNTVDKDGNVVTDESNQAEVLTGEYQLYHTNIWDSALRFTADMYRPGYFQCLSFTGPYKHLKLTKGGAILTDNEHAYKWLKKARFSGRAECSYHEDNFDDNPVIGINAYMIPEIAARGVQMMSQFYNHDGSKRHNEDLSLPYPDLSKFKLWQPEQKEKIRVNVEDIINAQKKVDRL